MKNLNVLRALALAVTFLSGMVAYHTYFKATNTNLVKLENTKSGKFVIINDVKGDGHIYELNELEMASKPFNEPTMQSYSEGGSQSYHMPTGKK